MANSNLGEIGRMTHDLIVVGGGPAGATCARKAVQLGLDVLLLEKVHHPRRKACGGGVTLRVRDQLDFNFSSVVGREQCGLRLFSPSGLVVENTREEVTGFNVRREDFDHLLLRKAEEAGAEVLQGVKVTDVSEKLDGVVVSTDDGPRKGKFLVGADGVNSTVARKTGIKTRWQDDEIVLCMEASVPMDSSDIKRIFGGPNNRALIEIHFGGLPHGYGWAFAKKEEISLGFGVLVSEMKDLKGIWKTFVSDFEKRNGVKCDLSEATAARVPLSGFIKNTCSKKIMLIGDAAGCVSPATGEGIYYSIESGQIAAEVTKEMLSGVSGVSTRTYHRRCRNAFGKDLGVAKFLAGIMFHSIKSMELVCQMAHDDRVMNDYTFDMIIALKSSKQSRNRMVKRMLRKHPVKALKMIA
jgi:geranylgeranyl reductase family protein